MNDEVNFAEISQVSFESLKLRPGLSLEIQQTSQGSTKDNVQLLAAVKGKSIMVALKGESGVKTTLEAGKNYIIRGFSGQLDFTFSSLVSQIFCVPFEYAMLTYPDSVEARIVRKTVRTKTSLPAVVSPLGKDIQLNVVLADLSISGAMINAPSALGTQGDAIKLGFTTELDNKKIDLSLLANIRYANKCEVSGRYNIGVEFNDVSQNDKFALHYVAQTFAENETNVVVS